MNPFESLKVEIYADGASAKGIAALNKKDYIKGLTTNPTLMRKAGISDYEKFARDILTVVTEKPISFEVFADDFAEMKRQALKIAPWGKNVYVKIPITNSRGESSCPLVADLAKSGVKLNITAIFTLQQVWEVALALDKNVPALVSVFAGRLADSGIDPVPVMTAARALLADRPQAQLLWASVREVYNIWHADQCGCHVVTVPHDILDKAVKMAGKSPDFLSLDTVQMFVRDATAAGYKL